MTPEYFTDASGQRFNLAGHRPCNYQSTTQRHNFGRYCRCTIQNPYGFGGLVEKHTGPHICVTCGRKFTK